MTLVRLLLKIDCWSYKWRILWHMHIYFTLFWTSVCRSCFRRCKRLHILSYYLLWELNIYPITHFMCLSFHFIVFPLLSSLFYIFFYISLYIKRKKIIKLFVIYQRTTTQNSKHSKNGFKTNGSYTRLLCTLLKWNLQLAKITILIIHPLPS